MAAPPSITKWVNEQHPRPIVDPDWLRECCAWIASSYSLSPASNTDLPEFTSHITSQFFQSSLTDSTLPNTGLPVNIRDIKGARLTGPPCLVEIRAISDIANSAFSLMNVRQNRMDRADLAGLVREGVEDAEEDEGPVPKYPRGMLRLELSDGFTTVEAVEYRSIPQLELGVTPLGYKILLKDVQIRRGIIFLEPKTIELRGHQTADHELMQDEIFLRSLSRRLGKPDPVPNPQPAGEAEAVQPAPPPVRVPSGTADRLLVQVGSPPKCSTSTDAASAAVRSNSASTAVPKASSAPGVSKPSSNSASTSSTPISSSKPTSSLKLPLSNHSALSTSPYFSASSTSSTLCSTNPSTSTSSTSNVRDNPSAPLARARILSPAPRDTTWSPDDEEFEAFLTESGPVPASPPRPISKLPSRNISSTRPVAPASEAPRPPSPPSDYDLDSMDLDVDDELLAQVERMEAEALAAACKLSGANGPSSDVRLDANVSRAPGGSSARPQASTSSSQASTSAPRMISGSSRPRMVSTIRTPTSPRHPQITSASTQRHSQNAISQQLGSGNTSSQRKGPASASTHRHYFPPPTLHEDVIVVDSEDDMYVDDSDDGKENVPLSAQPWTTDDEDVEVIDISD